MANKSNAEKLQLRKDYSAGVARANRGVDSLVRIFGGRAPQVVAMAHDAADKRMYHAIAEGQDHQAQYNKGQAMGYGMYAHTGKKLPPNSPSAKPSKSAPKSAQPNPINKPQKP